MCRQNESICSTSSSYTDICLRCEAVKIKRDYRNKQRDVTHRDRMRETAKYNMLISARADRTARTGETADHRQVHKAKGQPVTGSVVFFVLSFISLSLSALHLLRLLCPSSSPGQLRQISCTHSHHAVIYPDSTLRLLFCFKNIHLQKIADRMFPCIYCDSISCC